jgi:aspartate racemase
MKTIGLIGGTGWESTAPYYQILNREVARRLGQPHSAPLHLIGVDSEDIAACHRAADWDGMGNIVAAAARQLQRGGADCVLMGTNTMHKVAPQVQAAIDVPLLHIADATVQAVKAANIKKVGLLGSRFSLEQPFYRAYLTAQGVESLVPSSLERDEVHRIITTEIGRGQLEDASLFNLLEICAGLASRGARGVVVGSTELAQRLHECDVPLPLFDATALHAMAAVEFALAHSAQ